MPQSSEPVTITQKRFQCRHVHATGHQCGSPALRSEEFCYFHHKTRRPKPAAGKFRHLDAHEPFQLPVVEDLPSALSVAAQILCRIASNDLDVERAGRLLYSLQIITSILDKASRAPAKAGAVAVAKPEPLEELVADEIHGPIAPITEYVGAPFVPALSGRVGSASEQAESAPDQVESTPPPPERDYTTEEQDYFKNTVSNRGYEPYSEFTRPPSITDQDIEIRVNANRRARGFLPFTALKDADGKLITIHELGARYTTPVIALLNAYRLKRNSPQPATIPILQAAAPGAPWPALSLSKGSTQLVRVDHGVIQSLNAAAELRPTRKMRSIPKIHRRKFRRSETFRLTCT